MYALITGQFYNKTKTNSIKYKTFSACFNKYSINECTQKKLLNIYQRVSALSTGQLPNIPQINLVKNLSHNVYFNH